MPRPKVEDDKKLVHNLAVKFCKGDLATIHEKARKAGHAKPGTWARITLLKAKV